MNVLSLLWQRAIEDIMELGTNVDDIAESLLRIRNLGIKSTCEIIRRICLPDLWLAEETDLQDTRGEVRPE
jgi:DNA-directed RNA polymerase alpha subunit